MATGHASEAARWQTEAERLAAENAVLRAQVAALSEKVATFAKMLFGTSSEKNKRVEPPERSASGENTAEGTLRRPRGQQPGSKGHGRRDRSGLSTKEVVHDVPEGERVCPLCGAAYTGFGEECSEQIDWQVRLCRIVHRRPTYHRNCRCPVRGVLVAPVPDKPIPKGLFTVQFLARLLVEKYVLGRPLERIVAALGNDGFEVAKGTLVGTLKALSQLLAPLDAAIRARNAEAAHLHVDETSWNVYETVANKVGNRWWLWTFLGPDTVVFIIDPTRSTTPIADHLGIDVKAGSLAEGRHLLVSSDFYAVYQSLAGVDGLDPLWCFAHIRRYFIRAGDARSELKGWATAWTERIGALYVAHRARGSAEPGSRDQARAEKDFASALRAIDTARKIEMADETLHPRAQEVLATLDHEWEGLARHSQFLELPLDNNAAERALRNPVVMRKNCYGSGSAWAATLAARVWTVTATAQRAGCNPLSYLTCYLDACASSGGKAPSASALEAFFPWAPTEADLATWTGVPPGPDP